LYHAAVRTDNVADKSDVYDVFISYNWDHQTLLQKIVDRLKAASISVWFDRDNMCTSCTSLTAYPPIITGLHHLHAVCRYGLLLRVSYIVYHGLSVCLCVGHNCERCKNGLIY